MIERYLVVASRICQELADLERVVTRAEQAMSLARHSTEHDFYLDSVALNLHDFYGGLERIFRHIATDVDQSLPGGPEWHRDLLRQVSIAILQLRPQVISENTVKGLDEYLRFRHIVRNVYAFKFDVERIDRLIRQLRPLFKQVRLELMAFVSFLEQV
ncbi:MAG TPA: hypothetical protein VLH40_07350 [Atribacteraceae bacterium]|nr:hypothetical protein [Atribacteraceae bacterium]